MRFDDVDLAQLADRLPTPFYAYSASATSASTARLLFALTA
ncbi:MAG TPA: hypothetical protein VM555_00950 [Tahibacter sp.]|nr:hypothetical protein [Tahibacter sp.]